MSDARPPAERPAAARPGDLPRALGLVQTARLAALAGALTADWLVGRAREAFAADPAALAERRRARGAARTVAALGALKGVFAKAGQFAAIRHDVLPATVTAPLAALRDRVPPLAFARIRAAVERELGAPLDRLFASFEEEPLGAASIAQVHRARLPGGEPVAVKVQYPWLAASLRADLAITRALLALGTRSARSRLDRQRLFAEFAAGLRDELDFEREARAAVEIAANLAGDPQIVVPRVHPSHSGRRVLTMSYHPAVSVRDAAGLRRLGVDPAAVLQIVGRAYAKQVFADGHFHADPHPGNLFVVDEPSAAGKPRVLFVDFGLSRRLDAALRGELRRGLLALLQRDLDAFLAAMQRMDTIAPGAEPRVREAVAAMFARIGERGALGMAGGQVLGLKDEAVALLRGTEGLQLPNDLLLYAKTMSTVFALGAELAPEVDLMQVSLPYLLQFLGERE